MVANKSPSFRTVQAFKDGLVNVAAGLGLANKKVSGNRYVDVHYSEADLVGAFNDSTWYSKILSIPVDDSLREWRKWRVDGEEIDDVMEEEKRLGYISVIREARRMARHQGGALVVIGGLPGSPTSELEIDQIARGDISYLHALSRHEVQPGELVKNPYSEHFRRPEYWTINDGTATGVQVHASRVIFFPGEKAPGSILAGTNVWGNPLWSRLHDAVIAADSGGAILSALLHEAKQDVVTIPNLAEILTSDGGDTTVMSKFQTMAIMKSISNVVVLDGGNEEGREEKWEQKQFHWQGLPDVVKALLTIMSGAADIPLTRMLGEQQTGLSGNDAGSLRHYYDAIGAHQKLEIGPTIRRLDQMLLRSAIGETDKPVSYRWNPIWQQTPTEQAEVAKLEAETVQIYSVSGMVPKAALVASTTTRLIESERWPGLKEEIEKLGDDWAEKTAEDLKSVEQLEEAGASGEGIANDNNQGRDPNQSRNQQQASDMAPQPLYVSRKVLNASEVLRWAEEQGFENTLEADDLHVTIVYSREAVDWMAMGESFQENLEVAAGGPRVVEKFGEATVISFAATELSWRHYDAKSAGASWDYEQYQPHITVSYDPAAPRPEDIEPYRGRIVLGPEIFEPLNENWSNGR